MVCRCIKKTFTGLFILGLIWCYTFFPEQSVSVSVVEQHQLNPHSVSSGTSYTTDGKAVKWDFYSYNSTNVIQTFTESVEFKKVTPRFVVPHGRMVNQTDHIKYLFSNSTDLINMNSEEGREIFSRIKLNCRDSICSEFLTTVDKPHFKYCVRKTWNVPLRKYSEPKNSKCIFIDGSNRFPMAIASYPGSGNTWVRGLFQKVTGLCTGAIYCDITLRKNGYPGESIRSGAAFLVKSHQTDPRWEGVTYDPHAPLTYFKKVEHIPVFSGGVFILRNPFHAMIAEYKRQMWVSLPDNHVRTLRPWYFGNNSKWDRFVKSEAIIWQQTVLGWLVNNMDHPVMTVKYEDLKVDTGRELERILHFLHVPYSSQQFKKVVKEGYNDYRRIDRKNLYQHYTESQKRYVADLVTSTSDIINNAMNRKINMLDYLEP